MSYLVHVWEQPVPVTFEDAKGILDRLFKQRANAPSDKLDRLVRTLWTRYPRDIDNDVSDPVWADTFSKDARLPLPVETLAISTPHLDEVVPVVVKAARDLGLVAYDPQYGTLYLPDGRVLGQVPPEAREPAQPLPQPPAPEDPGRLLGVEQASALLVRAMDPCMAAHGFQWKKLPTGDAWVRTFEGGEQRFAPVIDSKGLTAGLTVMMRAHLFAVDPFVQRFAQASEPTPTDVLMASLRHYLVAAGDPMAGSLFERQGLQWRIAINTASKLDAAVAAIKEIVHAVVADMRPCETVAGLWQSALDEAQGRRKARFMESIEAKLVAGAMLGSSRIDEVAAQEMVRYETDLVQRRVGASEAKLQMLADEEGRIKESLARLVEFVRTQVRTNS